jgi:hypothetical protein
MQAINIFLELVISFKNKAFSEEAEWRLAKVMQQDLHKPKILNFRTGYEGLIPYLDTYICSSKENLNFPLFEIKVGPLSEPDKTKASIKLFTYSSAENDSPISISRDEVVINDAGYRIR